METNDSMRKMRGGWGNLLLIVLIIFFAGLVVRWFDIYRDAGLGFHPYPHTSYSGGGPEGIGEVFLDAIFFLGSLFGAAAAALPAYNAPFIGRRRKRVLGKEALLSSLIFCLAANVGLSFLHWYPDLYRTYFSRVPNDWILPLSLVQVCFFLIVTAFVSLVVNRAGPGDWIEKKPVRHVAAGSGGNPVGRMIAASVCALAAIFIVFRLLTLAHLGNRMLIFNAERGDMAGLKRAMASGVNVNFMDAQGRRALQAACYCGNEEAVRLLLDRGADVNAADRLERTPLDLACFGLHPEIVRLLLDKGARIDDKCLPSACQRERWESFYDDETKAGAVKKEDVPVLRRAIVEMLLKQGAPVDPKDKGHSALSEAAADGDLPMVQFLLQHGADVNRVDWEGRTALITAVSAGEISQTAKERCIPIVHLLLDHGANPNFIERSGSHDITAMWEAANYYPEAVFLLLDHGADPNLGSFSGTLLYDVVMNRAKWKLADIRRLLERGIDPNALNKRHESALGLACQQKDIALIELLLEKGAKPDIPGHTSYSPMWQAIVNDDVQMVRLLLDHGANPEFRPNASAEALLTTAVKGPDSKLEIIKLLLDRGANVDPADKYGVTPLLIAIEEGKLEIAKFLLERGANANAAEHSSGRSTYSAINFALARGPDYILPLLDHGGDPNQEGIIFKAIYKGWFDVVKTLVEKGADLSVRDNLGHTSLESADALGRKDIAAYLREKTAVKK